MYINYVPLSHLLLLSPSLTSLCDCVYVDISYKQRKLYVLYSVVNNGCMWLP